MFGPLSLETHLAFWLCEGLGATVRTLVAKKAAPTNRLDNKALSINDVLTGSERGALAERVRALITHRLETLERFVEEKESTAKLFDVEGRPV